jgi:hypothetical protein
MVRTWGAGVLRPYEECVARLGSKTRRGEKRRQAAALQKEKARAFALAFCILIRLESACV